MKDITLLLLNLCKKWKKEYSDKQKEEFVEDLKTLEQLCRAGLDVSKEY